MFYLCNLLIDNNKILIILIYVYWIIKESSDMDVNIIGKE